MRTRPLLAAVAALAVAGLAGATTLPGAEAAPPGHRAADPAVLADGLVGPLSLAVADDGTVYVAQSFTGEIDAIPAGGGEPTPVYNQPQGQEVGALSVDGDGALYFATTTKKKQILWKLAVPGGPGGPVQVADLGKFEKQNNPDAGVKYGFKKISKSCAAQVPKKVPVKYTGIVESHPYGSAVSGDTVYVADAAGNDVLAVDGEGTVSSVGVLPAVPVKVTKKLAKGNKLPKCTIGLTYRFEGVPTDVEVGGDGLVLSSLAGGPEDGSVATGSVLALDPASGQFATIADGLVSATGVATAGSDVWATQLFTGEITQYGLGGGGSSSTVDTRPLPAAVEYSGGTLYVTDNAIPGDDGPPNGEVIAYPVL